MTAALLTSIDRARRYLTEIPGAVSGSGGHNQTFAAACALVNGFALSEHDAFALLAAEYNQRCSPPWSDRELWHKIKSAAAATQDKPRGHLLGTEAPRPAPSRVTCSTPARPKLDPATAVENWLKGFRCTEFDLWDASPIKPPADFRLGTARMLTFTHAQGELLNIVWKYELTADGKARPSGCGETRERDEWIQRIAKEQPQSTAGAWIRMNPVDGRGIADANVAAFRYALVECDGVPLELQLPLLAKLPIPTMAILTSGGRSYHAWVRVDADDANDYRKSVKRMLELLARFGVDGKNSNPSRLSRLPGVVRSIGAAGDGRQRLLYLNPKPEQRSIL